MTTAATAVLRDGAGNELTGRQITWESGSNTIATVNATGTVTAAGVGQTFIRATSETIAGQANVNVVQPVVGKVTVTPATVSLTKGKTQALTATLESELGNPISRPVTWTTSAAAVATVSDQGLVTAAGLGNATITATSEGKTGNAAVTVNPFSFGTGTRVVGTEVPPGLYRSINATTAFCYWERLSGFGGTSSERIANDLGGGPRLVEIASSDVGFSSSGCATWTEAVGPTTSSPTAPFEEGVYLVGTDVAAGLWRSVTTSGSSCYWERLTGFGGTSSDRITNDLGKGPRIVSISPTDKGFSTSSCAQWAPVTGPVTTSPTADFGEGVFTVGSDIAPGTWRSNGTGTSCYWERLRGFSGESADRITNNLGPNPMVVTIAPTDVGFSSSGCGTWTKIG